MSTALNQSPTSSNRYFERVSGLKRWSSIFLTGTLLGMSYSPFPLPWLAWIALVPLLHLWSRQNSPREILVFTYYSFLITFAISFSWPLTHKFADTALLSLPGLLVMPIYMALPFFLSAFVRKRMGLVAGLISLMTFYLTMEYGLTLGPLAFPWTLLGYTQAIHFPFNQVAEIAGVPGLSLWILVTNAFAFLFIQSKSSSARLLFLILFGGCIVAVFGFGRHLRTRLAPADTFVDVGVVQPAVDAASWADVHDTFRVDVLLALSDSLLKTTTQEAAKIIIWPETALPVTNLFPQQDQLHTRLQQWVDVNQTDLLTGAIIRSNNEQNEQHYYNAAILYRPDADKDAYFKNRLVPFAEHVPFVDRLSWLEALAIPAGGVKGYAPGKEQNVLSGDGFSVGVLICFESVFGNYARRYVDKGADFIVTITQDGWWNDPRGYRQHIDFTRLRAIETRRCVVQVAVTGTTALVLPDGSTTFQSTWMSRQIYTREVPLLRSRTFYSRHGDWVSLLVSIVSLCLITIFLISRTIQYMRLRYSRNHR